MWQPNDVTLMLLMLQGTLDNNTLKQQFSQSPVWCVPLKNLSLEEHDALKLHPTLISQQE